MPLGASGLDVLPTPRGLWIQHVVPYSPAAQAHVIASSPPTSRLAFVNGEDALELYRGGRLEPAFASTSVMVTLGVQRSNELRESLLGPFVLILQPSPDERSRAALDDDDWRTAAALAGRGMLGPDATDRVWSRLTLESRQAARAGRYSETLALAGMLAASDRASLAGSLGAWQAAWDAELQADRRLLPRERFCRGHGPVLWPARPPHHARASRPPSRGRRRHR